MEPPAAVVQHWARHQHVDGVENIQVEARTPEEVGHHVAEDLLVEEDIPAVDHPVVEDTDREDHVGHPVEEDTLVGIDHVAEVHPLVHLEAVHQIEKEGTLPDLAAGWDHCVQRWIP